MGGVARIEHTTRAWDVVAGYFKQNEPERKISAGHYSPCGEPYGGQKHALKPYFVSPGPRGVLPLLVTWGEGEGENRGGKCGVREETIVRDSGYVRAPLEAEPSFDREDPFFFE